jgi:DNA-binding transcriptional LysR family regulator
MLDEMRTFVVLAESGSLQQAAERLFLKPSAGTPRGLGMGESFSTGATI